MTSAGHLLRKTQDELEELKNFVFLFVTKIAPRRWHHFLPNALAIIVVIVIGLLYFKDLIETFDMIKGWLRASTTVVTPLPNPEDLFQTISLKNIDDAKVMQAVDDRCNTSNNFERTLWKTGSMRIISWDADTGEPDLYGAKQEEPYQSLMVYEIPCQLPLVATVSATIQSPSSLGMVFEFDGVLQVILGDGDLRSIRYKTDTLGSRKMGWRYVPEPTKGTPLTHWLPDEEKVSTGTQVDWTISLRSKEESIEVQVSLSYQLRSGQYKTHIFPQAQMNVQSYNIEKNVGRFIRVGINDQLYKGTQSAIRFRHFSIRSGS